MSPLRPKISWITITPGRFSLAFGSASAARIACPPAPGNVTSVVAGIPQIHLSDEANAMGRARNRIRSADTVLVPSLPRRGQGRVGTARKQPPPCPLLGKEGVHLAQPLGMIRLWPTR